ncbi:Uu.00g042670.m01.CDS01 [Anthostomella pinea]|uniref:Uu.00g042670.m01.CDS01 n=1 Tax=Anthostomella pinea TaxID=933095 RepID=A0AAI8VAI4_9PEZI|nr:Uu.00g042670.m01.CDS01 [Anthostomella pinea]
MSGHRHHHHHRQEYDDDRGYQQQGYQRQGYQEQPQQFQQPVQHFQQFQQPQYARPQYSHQQGPRRKSLLIGINYVGSQHALQGCHQDVDNVHQFLSAQGYSSDPRDQVIMRDDSRTDPRGPFWPNGHNMLAAMQWLVSEPGTCCFLHYSGHGGQVKDPDGDRASGYDDTIVPVDFEARGQLDSDTLHKTIVSRMPSNSTLMVLFDCCHSGSAIELPYVYRSDGEGNVSMVDNVKQGVHLMTAAYDLIQGGFNMNKVQDAKQLLAGATSFFKGLQHKQAPADENGLAEDEFVEDWKSEHKNVWMYSGCRDDQTSADASIAGAHVGAMSWAFLESMKRFGRQQSFIQVLQNTRQILRDRYKQVPQLSAGYEMDLNRPIAI